jgi:hypothetical protein
MKFVCLPVSRMRHQRVFNLQMAWASDTKEMICMNDQSAAARCQRRRHRWLRALAGSAALAAAVGAFVTPASSAGADNLSSNVSFINNPTGLCVDVPGGIAVPSAMVRSWSCNYSSAQQWVIDYSNETILFAANENYCLDVYENGTSEGSPIDIYYCNGQLNQQWVVDTSDGFISNPQSGLCLNVPGQNPNEGQQLWLWDCNPNPLQWWFTRTGE